MSNKTQKQEIQGLGTHAEDPILNLSAVADAVGRSPQTIGRWIEDGLLPCVVLPNGLRKVRKSALIALLGVAAIGQDTAVQDRVSALEEVL